MARFQYISGKRRVFVKLRQCGTISRAELARQCSLTRPAVSSIIEELISSGMVRERGPGHSTGGKPPILLEFLPESRCAIGIDLGGDRQMEGVLCDLGCGIIAGDSQRYENRFSSIVDSIGMLIARLVRYAPGIRPSGVGIAVSAMVDAAHNEVIRSKTLDIERKNLADAVQELTTLPVRIERRPNAAALAEALFGEARESRQLLYVTSGLGVGAGMVIGGELYRGVHGFSGEIGDLRLPDSRRLEDAARPSSMLAEYAARCKENIDFDEFLRRFRRGDECAKELISHNAAHLAHAAAVAANLFDPDAIVLGGDVLDFGDEYFNRFCELFRANAASWALEHAPKLYRSSFGRRGVAVGGAQLILDESVN